MKLRPITIAFIAFLCSALSQASAAIVDFSGVNLTAVSSPSGQNFSYTLGAGSTTGLLNVRLLSGPLSSLTTGSSPVTTGFYAIQSAVDLTPAVFRFSLDTSRTFTLSENETLTTIENNAFTLSSGSWTVISSSGATVGGSGSTINFQGTSNSPSSVAYSVQGTGSFFDFQITNSPGFPEYGSAISVDVVPEPSSIALIGFGIAVVLALSRKRLTMRCS